MTVIKYVAIDTTTGRIVFEENTFQMVYKMVNSFNRKHNNTKLKIAKKVITTTIETMERPR